MMILRRLFTIASLALLLVVASPAFAESRADKGHSDGTFVEIEQGDYAHFVIKTKAGRESFCGPISRSSRLSTTAAS
jgi:hypothetical protein